MRRVKRVCVPSLGTRPRSVFGTGTDLGTDSVLASPTGPGVAAIIRTAVPSQATTFVAVVLERDHSPDEALTKVHALHAEQDVLVRDAAVVVRTELGRIELQQTKQIAPGESIVGGGTAGLV